MLETVQFHCIRKTKKQKKTCDFQYIFRYLAGVAKRTFNIFYHFDFIYKRSALYEENSKYTEIADRLPCRVLLLLKKEFLFFLLKIQIDCVRIHFR